MSHLIVRNIGPIKEVDIDLTKVNVFIGAQSSGKSTLAKIISFCTWLDKHNESTTKKYVNGVIHSLKKYHRLTGAYFSDDSVIFYQGDNVAFAYNWPEKEPLPFDKEGFEPESHLNSNEIIFHKPGRATNPKVIYIPAERNFVSAVPNLRDYQEDNDNLQDFVNTWFRVKRKYTKDKALDVLNLGFKYHYQEDNYQDLVTIENGKSIPLEASSSGLQSIIPLLVLVNWMSEGIYAEEKPFSPAESEEIEKLIMSDLGDSNKLADLGYDKVKRFLGFLSGRIYTHTQFIIEEPEQNLFPETQCELMANLAASINHGKNHRLVLTTHSPYIVNYLNVLLRRPSDAVANIPSENLAVYRIYNGKLQNLMMQNEQTGEIFVDTRDLSETIRNIYQEYDALAK